MLGICYGLVDRFNHVNILDDIAPMVSARNIIDNVLHKPSLFDEFTATFTFRLPLYSRVREIVNAVSETLYSSVFEDKSFRMVGRPLDTFLQSVHLPAFHNLIGSNFKLGLSHTSTS